MSRRLIAALVVGGLAAAATLPPSFAVSDDVPGAWTIEQLTDSLAKIREVDGVFHERKDMTILEQPLLSSGFLRYRAPDFLEKQVLQPEPQTYRIDGGRVSVETRDGRREFSLDSYPGVRPLTESVRATLAGDRASLERYFRLTLSGSRDGWSLSLEPVDENIAERIADIVISGSDDRLLRVETIETNGDRTVMDVTPVAE